MNEIQYITRYLEMFGITDKQAREDCARQIAQSYGAIRYLDGVIDGATAVEELGRAALIDNSPSTPKPYKHENN